MSPKQHQEWNWSICLLYFLSLSLSCVFRQSKFTVKMSRDSYNHMKRYLMEKKMNILLNIIHEHLFVDGE